jgi:hypothetical protein
MFDTLIADAIDRKGRGKYFGFHRKKNKKFGTVNLTKNFDIVLL